MKPEDDLTPDFFRFLSNHPDISWVCFDFFDTLVYRTVEPEYTKRLACNQLSKLLGNIPNGGQLYRWRSDLEARLCRNNVARGGDLDFNFLEFSDAFHERVKRWGSILPAISNRNAFQNLLLDIEIAVELHVQRIFADAARLLQSVYESGVKTVIISDFYIPAAYFQRLVHHHGFSDWVDHIFVSADLGLTKASGRFYEIVLQTLACNPDQAVMIGDNPHSDAHMASGKGLHVFPLDRQTQKDTYHRWARKRSTGSFRSTQRLAQGIRRVVAQTAGMYFPEMALALWRFIDLLFHRLVRENVRNVFFCSKEGQFLKALFEQYQSEQFGSQRVHSHYLLVSRKSTYICSLKPLFKEDFSRIFRQYQEIAPRDFLLSLNFSAEEAKDLCQQLGLSFDRRLRNFHRSDAFISLVGAPAFAQRYERKRQYQRRQLLAYLASFGVDINIEGLTMVDVGWKGSIQDNLHDTLNGKVVVNGYYIGLLQPTHLGPSNRKTGILFSDTPFETPFFQVFNCNRSLFEMLLTADHGSADGYYAPVDVVTDNTSSTGGKADPFLYQGNVAVKTVDFPEERALFEKRIRPIQDRFRGACREINRLIVGSDAQQPAPEWWARRHARMVYHPTAREIAFYQALYHLENFGIFEFTDFKAHRPQTLQKRMRNLVTVIKNPKSVLAPGIWPPVVLDRLGLRSYRRFFGAWCYYNTFHGHGFMSKWWNRTALNTWWLRVKPKNPLTIAFLLGSAEISGGTYVIYEHAVRMKRMGHRVSMLTQHPVQPQDHAWHPDAETLEWLTLEAAGKMKFDFAIATYWLSALILNKVSADNYVYFVQSIESRFFPPEEEASVEEIVWKRIAERTYLLPLPIITEAHWIQRYLRETYGHEAKVVLNGIRKDIYTASGPCHSHRTPGKLRVLVEGPLGVSYKNVERTIEICRRSSVDKVWLLTASPISSYPGVDRVFSRVHIEQTPLIYRSCDVLVKLTYLEGMFGPPLEMFHCGGTAIVYDVCGHDEYIRHDQNSLVIATDDEDGVVAGLNRLKSHPELLERLKTGARMTAQGWPGWQTSSQAFEQTLRGLAKRSGISQDYLTRITNHMQQHTDPDINSLKLFPFTSCGRPIPQRCQLYWDQGEGFSESESHKIEYEFGEWVNVQFTLVSRSGTINLRIDPCNQVGIVRVERIQVLINGHEKKLLDSNIENGWSGLEITGDATQIEDDRHLIIEANDQDPQILLPAMSISDPQTKIDVHVRLKFTPFPMAVRELLKMSSRRTSGASEGA